jgi:tetratricopeptide (TPR) repeat protein
MPRIEDIERFAQVLNSLGDEPAVRAAHSESIEAVPAPGSEPDSTDADSLDSLPAESQGSGAELPGEQENLQDLFDGLSALPDTEASSAEEPPVEPQSAPAEPGAEGEAFDFSSLFGDESAQAPIEDLGTPTPQPAAQPEEDAFSFPEGEPEQLQADLSQMEVLPEDIGAVADEEPAEGAPAESPGESFEDFGAFPLDAGETPAPDQTAEGVELPNLDDLSFSEPGAEEPAAPAETTDTFETPAAEPEPFDSGTAEMPSLDNLDFDTAGLGEAPAESTESTEEQPAETAEPESEAEGFGEEALGDLNLDEFSLPESAEQFGMQPAESLPPPPPPPRPKKERQRPRVEEPVPEELPEATAGEISLTPEQFARLKVALEALPRNLKIVVQDLIGEGTAGGADLAKLIALLMAGAGAQEIATLAGRIAGKRIRVPAGYEKKTGLAFEEESRTFGYAFRENILPILRIVIITVVVGALVGFLGYRFVYRPLYAYSNYRSGYAQIANDRFGLANERFTRAVRVWPMKSWFYRYAEAFAGKRQFVLAEEKYDDLLKRFPDDSKGILDYAHMESASLSDYEKADSLLKRILDKRMYDYDALIASGDNQLEWAARDHDKYAAARLTYATLIEKYGVRDEFLFRMLRYFMRTDNGEEVERLRAYYASRPDAKIDAGAFAELGGFLVDHRRLDYVQDVLFRADKAKRGLYEVHYNLARYYRIVQAADDEKLALDATVRMLSRSDPLTPKRLSIEIDTHTRLGEYYYRTKEYIAAEKDLQTAIRLVEQNQSMGLIGKERPFGRAYADLGDLYYYIQGDLGTAGLQYQNAIANAYTSPELSYKVGYIQYAQRDYKSALATFTQAEDASAYPNGNESLAPAATDAATAFAAAGQTPQNLLYALGNSFYQRGDYFAAQGYFLRLREALETKRERVGRLDPDTQSADRALLDTLVKVDNNLGVTMVRLSERTGERRKKSEALVYLTAATEIAASLGRNPATVQRSADRSLPSLNMRGILYPVTGFVLQLYPGLPKDFQTADW